jgi:AraC-like DNA-binding protein
VQVLRDPQIISGFIYEDPIAELPGLTHCGEALCCRGHTLASHAHPAFEFLYLSRGEAHWQDGAGRHDQRIGELFVAYPHVPHATGPERNPENQHVWIGLRLGQFGPEGRRLARELQASGTRILPGCQELEPVLRAIVSQVVAFRPQRAHAARALIGALISLIRQRLATLRGSSRVTPAPLPYSVPVQRSLAYMRQHLDRRIPLRDMAGAATVANVTNFCSRFRAEVGVPPAAYHAMLRLEAAREMLRQPAFDVTTAALQSGFSSTQHFSTAFRRAFGLTPREWRTGGSPGAGTGAICRPALRPSVAGRAR